MKILLTGASGFVGRHIAYALDDKGINHLDVVRGKKDKPSNGQFCVASIDDDTCWDEAFLDVSCVIHSAARVHVMSDTAYDPLDEYRSVNVSGTCKLAQKAAEAGVKRFIYISTIKVNGESTTNESPYTELMPEQPQDDYSISKYEAEEKLRQLSLDTGMEVIIVRPPLVYGPGVKANFLNLLKLSDSIIPLPFGHVNNKRSMVYVGNLVDFVIRCITYSAAGNQTFLISDGEDLSLSQLVKCLRTSLGRASRLISFPVSLFRLAGVVTKNSTVVDRLIGDLCVDSSKAKQLLGWKPPFTVKEGIQATVNSYLEGRG